MQKQMPRPGQERGVKPDIRKALLVESQQGGRIKVNPETPTGTQNPGTRNSETRNDSWPPPRNWGERSEDEREQVNSRVRKIMEELGEDVPIKPMG
jgi:hypothetical protein